MDSKSISSVEVVLQKLEFYCSYQERCHVEVREKLRQFSLNSDEMNKIIVHLIDQNFLNEERYANLFAISKFHQKKWGKKRIKIELKARSISDYLITNALKAIPEGEYQETFDDLSVKYWNTILEKNTIKKRKKFCDYMLRKGWESDWVYGKAIQFENS